MSNLWGRINEIIRRNRVGPQPSTVSYPGPAHDEWDAEDNDGVRMTEGGAQWPIDWRNVEGAWYSREASQPLHINNGWTQDFGTSTDTIITPTNETIGIGTIEPSMHNTVHLLINNNRDVSIIMGPGDNEITIEIDTELFEPVVEDGKIIIKQMFDEENNASQNTRAHQIPTSDNSHSSENVLLRAGDLVSMAD